MLLHIQAVQKEIGKRKRYIDITGNWLNHPNDYLARILSTGSDQNSWNVKTGDYNEQVKD